MRKTVLPFIMLLSFPVVNAENISLVFRTADGSEQAIETQGLEVVFEDGVMRAVSASMSLSLPVAQLQSMEFSGIAAGVDAVAAEAPEGPVEIYGADGRKLGSAGTAAEAAEVLPAGMYILKLTDGSARKIAFRK